MRTLGALGMSVGTSLAFEGELSSTLKSLNGFLINLRTIVRNVLAAYESGDTPSHKQLVSDVKEDLVLIGKWIDTNRETRPISMVVYLPSYNGLKRKFPKADLWEPTTDRQKKEAKVTDTILKDIVSAYPKLIKQTDCDLPSFEGISAIMTHHIVDLVMTSAPTRLLLLESYTGLLKPYTKWNTRLTDGKQLFNMPFNRFTIQVFGDRGVNFRSSKHGIKTLVKKIADQGKWTSATTVEKVRQTINAQTSGVDRAGLLLLL